MNIFAIHHIALNYVPSRTQSVQALIFVAAVAIAVALLLA
jgi:hypothetical protein